MTLKQFTVVRGAQRGIENGQSVLAGRSVAGQIEAARAAHRALAKACNQRSLFRTPVGPLFGKIVFHFLGGQRVQLTTIERERMVGSSSPAFSASKKMVANSGGSSSTFSKELAASFMKAESVKM